MQGADGRGGGLFGRVKKREETDEHHFPLIRRRKLANRGRVVFLGHRNHPHPLCIQAVSLCENLILQRGRQRQNLA